MLGSLNQLYQRDLDKLSIEISSYTHEKILWELGDNIANTAGNLSLHICGNLQHFIGAVLGNSGYVRNRDLEFSARNISQEKLISEVNATKSIVEKTLHSLPEEALLKIYPIELFGHPMTTEYFLLHLLTHLNYHLGQINYHRRLLSK